MQTTAHLARKILLPFILIVLIIAGISAAWARRPTSAEDESLLIAKSYLLQGQVGKAQNQLNRITNTRHPAYPIKLHYQALIYLIQDQYSDLLKVLNRDRFPPGPRYGNICLLKFLAHVALGELPQARHELSVCSSFVLSDSNNELLWPELLVRFPRPVLSSDEEMLFLNPYDRQMLAKNNYVRPWLKFGAAHDQKKLGQAMLLQIVPETFQDHQIRELAGVLSYQMQDYEQALFFASDIDTPTIHNLRGNEFLKNQSYGEAWREFQQALAVNRYSLAALERSIPLAIIDHHYAEGLKYTATSAHNGIDRITLALLRSYFLLALGQKSAAQRMFAELGSKHHHFEHSLRYQLLMAYLAFTDHQPLAFNQYAAQACRLDAHYCWPLATSLTWPNMEAQQGGQPAAAEQEATIAAFKELSGEPTPMEEEAFISQQQIDQLDQMPLILQP